MKGFDPKFRDFPEYIFGITREIWEDRGIAALHRYYAPDIVVRTPAGLSRGNHDVVASTMAVLNSFPDRTLFGEDVIWCEGENHGLLSSHRILSTATHLGDGAFGPATGRPLVYRIIADCHARANVIDDEWLIRDQGAIVRQMGIEPAVFARTQIEREGGPERCVRPFMPDADVAGPYSGRGNEDEWGERYADLIGRIMNADFAAIPAEYDRACQLEHPGGRTGHSHVAADRFWLGLRAAFPSAKFRVEHRIGRQDPLMPPRAALRWSLTGNHDGWGAFGPPTGAEVHVMAISHAEFGPWGLRREWVLFDETAIWKQIVLATG